MSQGFPCAQIDVVGAPEYGRAWTDFGGKFAIVVNGGEPVTLRMSLPGYITAYRAVETQPLAYATADDVLMLPFGTAHSVLASATEHTVIAGALEDDGHGDARQAVLFVPPGTSVRVAGSDESPEKYDISIKEVTNLAQYGRAGMPASLPAQSAFTYAVNLSVVGAENQDVTFANGNENSIPFYVDNFLGFPDGEAVPAGRYDPKSKQWVAEANGVVVTITGKDANDRAILNPPLDLPAKELEALAGQYRVGKSLWRVPINHFSVWDFNWGWGPPADAKAPENPEPYVASTPCPATKPGSIIDCESRRLRERIPVAGTPFSLTYSSERQPGGFLPLRIPLRGATLPNGLKGVEVIVEVAGRKFPAHYDATPPSQVPLVHEFKWDGLDGVGNALVGSQKALVRVGYTYAGQYSRTSRFASSGGTSITGSRERFEATLWQVFKTAVTRWDAAQAQLGGWNLSGHHGYDFVTNTIHLGSGSSLAATMTGPMKVIAGTGVAGIGAENVPAISSPVKLLPATSNPAINDIAVAADGSVYFTELNRIRKIALDGTISTVAGAANSTEPIGDDGPALNARFDLPGALAFGPDGSLYVADSRHHRIRVIGTDGRIRTFAGTGVAGPFPGTNLEGVATASALRAPSWVAAGRDNTVYIADHPGLSNAYIRRVRDGFLTTVEPNGTYSGLSVAPDGNVYYSQDTIVNRLDGLGNGIRIAGAWLRSGVSPAYGDGLRATAEQGAISVGRDVTIGPDGLVYFVDSGHHAVRRVNGQGVLETVAGVIGVAGNTVNRFGIMALNSPSSLAFGPNGELYVLDAGNQRIVATAVRPGTPGGTLSSRDGRELYQFDNTGRHIRTLDGITGAMKLAFRYQNGALVGISHGERDDSGETLIERAQGVATAIVSPEGHYTALSVVNGELRSVTDPEGATYTMDYYSGRLLNHFSDPEIMARGAAPYTFTFADGRLATDSDPLGQSQQLAHSSITGIGHGWRVVHTQSGRNTIYDTEVPGGTWVRRTTRDPDQLISVFESRADGRGLLYGPDGASYTGLATRKDGSQMYWQTNPDARLAPIVSRQLDITCQGCPTRLIERSREIVAGSDPSAITSFIETETLNWNKTTTTEWNAATRTITRTSPAGRKTFQELDLRGRTERMTVDGIAPITFEYDPAGRLQTVRMTDNFTQRDVKYDYFHGSSSRAGVSGIRSRLDFITDEFYTFDRDSWGRLLSVTRGTETTGFGWDKNGNLKRVTPPGRPAHVLDYNLLNQLDLYTPPEPTPSGPKATDYSYTPDRMLARTALPDTSSIVNGYDTAGRLGSVTMPTGMMTLTYYTSGSGAVSDAAPGALKDIFGPYGVDLQFGYQGPLLKRVSWAGAVAGSVSFEYNNDFVKTSQTVAALSTSKVVSYGYDADNLVTCASPQVVCPTGASPGGLPIGGALSIGRSSLNGAITSMTLGAITETYTYNGYGELATKTARAGSTILADFTSDVPASGQTRDSLGRVVQKSERVLSGAAVTTRHVYDPQGRLTDVLNGTTTLEHYGYGPNGNRTSAATPSGTISMTEYDSQDRLKRYGSVIFDYTANGALRTRTESGTTTMYDYDVLGNLRSVVILTVTPITIEYLVDGLGRRVGKKVAGVVRKRWLYGDALKPVAELDGSGNLVSLFVYASNGIIPDFMVRGDKTYRIISDRLGSPRLVVNVNDVSDIPYRASYTAFGEATITGTADFIPFGFAGGLYDTDTKLVRFGARDYDPNVGRWVSKDPIRFDGGVNLYVYVGNDPINRIDPSGLVPWVEIAFPWLIALDTANWAGAATSAANILTPGASTSLHWNNGNPIVVLENSPWTFGNAGLTLGHVVALRHDAKGSAATFQHELAHVKQHDILGPAYLPLHGLAKAFCYAFSSRPIQCDLLEQGPYEDPPCPF
jgi:RHS repeat-associated protein